VYGRCEVQLSASEFIDVCYKDVLVLQDGLAGLVRKALLERRAVQATKVLLASQASLEFRESKVSLDVLVIRD